MRKLLILTLIQIVFISTTFSQNNSPEIGNDFERLQKSTQLIVSNSDLSILIPSFDEATIQSFKEIFDYQIIRLINESNTFLQYKEGQWKELSISEVISNIAKSLEISAPQSNQIILSGSADGQRNMLDYNGYIKALNSIISSDDENEQLVSTSKD